MARRRVGEMAASTDHAAGSDAGGRKSLGVTAPAVSVVIRSRSAHDGACLRLRNLEIVASDVPTRAAKVAFVKPDSTR